MKISISEPGSGPYPQSDRKQKRNKERKGGRRGRREEGKKGFLFPIVSMSRISTTARYSVV